MKTETNARLDGSLYLRLPKVTAVGGLSLARAILIALPKSAPGGVKHCAKDMRACAVTVQDALTDRRNAEKPATRSAGDIDNEADSLHGTIRRRLTDYRSVAKRSPDEAARAERLLVKLYPPNSDITHGDLYEQWQDTELWFGILAQDDNEAALRRLIGDVYVDALRATHVEYGEAVGTTKPLPATVEKVDVSTPLAALVVSMQDLALQLVAVANDRSADDELRAGARAALRPIDALREANARRASRRAGEEPDAPVDPDQPADPNAPLPDVK